MIFTTLILQLNLCNKGSSMVSIRHYTGSQMTSVFSSPQTPDSLFGSAESQTLQSVGDRWEHISWNSS
jgi:hypothetical protein